MIRWITPTLGTAPAGSNELDPDVVSIDVRDLVDKSGNMPASVIAKIDQGVALLKSDHRVVVCCDYGISRSNAIAAGILSRYAGISFDEAISEVCRATGEIEIKLAPLNLVRQVLYDDKRRVPPSRGRRILITGGSGFIGSALQRSLGESAFVISPSRQSADLTLGALSLDLIVKRNRIDSIVHLANPRIYTSASAIGASVAMMRNVLDVCRENGLRLLYLSGWEVYSGYKSRDLLAGETLPLLPKGPYGEAKMLCELLVKHHSQEYGINTTIMRSSPVYGADSDRPKFIYNFIEKAKLGIPILTHEYLNGYPHLDLLHIDDLLKALIFAIQTDISGDFNIGSGKLMSTYEIAHLTIEKTRSLSTVEPQKINDYAPNIRINYSKAKTYLGWSPTKSFSGFINELLQNQERNNDRN